MRGVGKNKTHLPANHIKGNGLFAGAEGVAHTRRFQLELRSSGSKKKDVEASTSTRTYSTKHRDGRVTSFKESKNHTTYLAAKCQASTI